MAENVEEKLRSRGARRTSDSLNTIGDAARSSSPRIILDPYAIDPASIHALQTAFVSLQRTHNDLAKKNQDLLQRNNVMQKALVNLNCAGGEMDVGMDDLYGPGDPSMAHAAGATGGEITAEHRANKGYVAHLEREVMKGTWAISKVNSNEKERMALQREKDRLLMELESVRESLSQKMEILHERDTEIVKMKMQIASLKSEISSYSPENVEKLREQVEKYERFGGFTNNSSELQDVKSRLLLAQNDFSKVLSECVEKEKQVKEREKQVMALEAKCQQFQIEVDIAKANRAAASCEALDTDGDIVKLTKALELIKTQRSVIAGLRQQVEVQGSQIKQMCCNTNKMVIGNETSKSAELRGNAQGSSLRPAFQEQAHMYMNVIAPGNLANSPQDRVRTSPIVDMQDLPHNDETDSPKEEDLYDVRCEISNSPAYAAGMFAQNAAASQRNDPNLNRVGNVCSPRISDAIMPTGNVKTMMATEMSQQVQKIAVNTIDSRTSPQGTMSQSMYSPSTNIVNDARSSPTYRQRDMRSSVSPSSGHGQRSSHVELTLTPTQNGARQKTNFSRYENTSLKPGNIPAAMTHSEIVYAHDRNNVINEEAMTRSVLEPSQPLIIAPENVMRPELKYQQVSSPARRTAVYEDNVPNYENIYTECQETEIKRPLVDDDTVFVTSSDLLPHKLPTNPYENVEANCDRTRQGVAGRQEWLASVSDLKICPVCNQEFSRLTMDQFQTHVFECFDNLDEPAPSTLQAPVDNNPSPDDDDRTCPMCGDTFPLTIPQETFEVHVLGHFGEQPEGYEIVE